MALPSEGSGARSAQTVRSAPTAPPAQPRVHGLTNWVNYESAGTEGEAPAADKKAAREQAKKRISRSVRNSMGCGNFRDLLFPSIEDAHHERMNLLVADMIDKTKSQDAFTGKFILRDGPSTFRQRLMENKWLRVCSGGLILANTIFVGWEVDSNMRRVVAASGVQPDVRGMFQALDVFFLAAFSVELVVRLWGHGLQFFTNDERAWNLLDLFLVCTAFMEMCDFGVNISFARVLRMLRLVKAMRVFRLVRAVKELRSMLAAIANSARALLWATIMLLLLMYLFSIVFMQGIVLHYSAGFPEVLAGPGLLHRDALPAPEVLFYVQLYYSTIPRTMLSLLHCITGGDWFNYLRPLIGVSWVFVIIFSVFIVFIVLGLMNILTGIFCDAAMSIKDRDHLIDEKMFDAERFLQDMVGLFLEADSEGTGTLNWQSLQRYFAQERVIHFFLAHQLDVSDATLVFELLDKNQDGDIDAFEFAHGCFHMRGQAKALDLSRLAKHSQYRFGVLASRLDALEGIIRRMDVFESIRIDALEDNIKAMMNRAVVDFRDAMMQHKYQSACFDALSEATVKPQQRWEQAPPTAGKGDALFPVSL